MSKLSKGRLGFSLIELLIVLVIVAILLALGVPAFGVWIGNLKIRSTAEMIQSGLQMAKAEAVRRNAQIRFQLTNSLGVGCVLSTVSGNWVISYDDISLSGACNASPLNEAFPAADAIHNPTPRILSTRSAAEGSANISVNADQAAIVFNGLGGVTPLPANNPIKIDISHASAPGVCVTYRCMRVTISPGGQIRMCDPQLGGTDPQRC